MEKFQVLGRFDEDGLHEALTQEMGGVLLCIERRDEVPKSDECSEGGGFEGEVDDPTDELYPRISIMWDRRSGG